jgi:hypothetical protein
MADSAIDKRTRVLPQHLATEVCVHCIPICIICCFIQATRQREALEGLLPDPLTDEIALDEFENEFTNNAQGLFYVVQLFLLTFAGLTVNQRPKRKSKAKRRLADREKDAKLAKEAEKMKKVQMNSVYRFVTIFIFILIVSQHSTCSLSRTCSR